MTRLAIRLYRLSLRAFPSRHRGSYSSEMLDAFGAALGDMQRREGRLRVLRFVLASCLDTIVAGISERRRTSARGLTPRVVLAGIGRDLRDAVRALSKARAFSIVSILSLGIGIGTVTTILMAVRGFTSTPPGVVTDGLVEFLVIPQGALRARVGDWAIDTWSYPDFVDLRGADPRITLAAWRPADVVLRTSAESPAVRVDAMYVTPNYFSVVGAGLARGAGFQDRDAPTQHEVIVSDRTWRRRLGSTADVVGSTLLVNGTPRVVVGVAPAGFRGHFAQHRPGFEVWLPLSEHPQLTGPGSLRGNRAVDWVQLLGRLSAGTTVGEANAITASLMAGMAERHPQIHAEKSAAAESYFGMGARRRADVMAETATLLSGAVIVLLVVCLNMSGMVLVRSAIRERELAVRLAIGASRGRLIQYLLAESAVLAVLGGFVALQVIVGGPVALAWWAGAPLETDVMPDITTFATVLAICLATSLVFGLLPAIRFSRPRILVALKEDGGGGRRVGRTHRVAAAIQAGIAVPFLIITGVRLEQVRTVAMVDLGFTPSALFAAPLDLATGSAQSPQSSPVDAVRQRLEETPEVTQAAAANGLPLDFQIRAARVAREDVALAVRAHTTRVSAGYFEVMQIPLLRGRGILAGDRPGSERVVVVSNALAARLFPDSEPVGATMTFALEGSHAPVDFRWPHLSLPAESQTFRIVGVTADVVDGYLGEPQPQLFVPLAQHPVSRVIVIARSSAGKPEMTAAFERAFEGLAADPGIVRATVMTGAELVRRGRRDFVFGSVVTGVAGAAALMLAALGVFGVIGFMVATRSREIGIRMALGATRSRVVRTVLVDVVRLTGWGIAAGVFFGWVWAGEVSSDPAGALELSIFAGAAGIALGVAVLAAIPAARRAAAVEPVIAMRAS